MGMTDDFIRIGIVLLFEAVILALMLFIVAKKYLDRLEEWHKEQIIRFHSEVYRHKHDQKRNKRANRHSTSPPDPILQGGKSDIDGAKLRKRGLEANSR